MSLKDRGLASYNMWRQVCLPGDGGEENQRRLISKETTNCHAHKYGFHPETMGSLHWILSQRRTRLDLLFKLQSDSNKKKEQVKECRLEHRSSKSGLQARASLPTAIDL